MGRPRKAGVKRTKSGRISRAADSYNENAEAIALRQKMFGLSEKDARDQKAATYVGRLCLAGQKNNADGVTDQQYEAAQEYLMAYTAFQRAVKSPDALRTSNGPAPAQEADDYAKWCQGKIARFEALKLAVRSEQSLHEHRGANMFAALDYLVLRDEAHPHMVGDLRLALNAIGRTIGIIPKRKKAA